MRLNESAAGAWHGVLAVGSLRLRVKSEAQLVPYVSNVLDGLQTGYSESPLPGSAPLDIWVSMTTSPESLAQDTPHGRFVADPNGSYVSRWGFWDVRLTGFQRGKRPIAELSLSPEVSPENYPDGIRMFLRTVVASAAPLVDSLMFHGCALAESDMSRSLLFLGASGDGKTTMAQRLDAWKCLGDDTVMVRCSEGQIPQVSGTPFAGSEGKARIGCYVPFQEVYFLRPGSSELRIMPIEMDQSFGELMLRLMWFVDGGPLRERMLDLMSRLSSSLRAARLESSLEHDISEVFRRPLC